jgi:hypothetical protein
VVCNGPGNRPRGKTDLSLTEDFEMQMIQDAISPERLAEARRLFEQQDKPSPEKVAADLNARLRKMADLEAELADRKAFEKNKVSAK